MKMFNNKNKTSFNFPICKTRIWLAVLISFLLISSLVCIIGFIPDFMFHTKWFGHNDQSFFVAFYKEVILSSSVASKTIGGIYLGITILLILLFTPSAAVFIRYLFLALNYKEWNRQYLNSCTKIVSSCKNMKINAKVAMVVCTCNDISFNTILQTAQQTYENMDVWISDDSNNPETIESIDNFCKKHGFYACHRDVNHKKAHPTKIGNLFYFLEKHGKNYDYIFENDSSAIVTPTFVENSLAFFETPLYDHSRDGGLICNGGFYGPPLFLSYMISQNTQIAESCASLVGGITMVNGGPIQLNGWCALYRTETLKQIPLKDIECPSCDKTRGFWLANKGYNNFLNPFDFSAKMCPYDMRSLKNQWLKWTGGDVFTYKQAKLSFSKFLNDEANTFIHLTEFSNLILLPVTFFASLVFTILIASLNFFYINFTAIVCLILYLIVVVGIFLIVLAKKSSKTFMRHFIWFAIYFTIFIYSTLYKKVFITLFDMATKKWSSGAITTKTINKITFKQKMKMILFDCLIILFGLALCLTLTFTLNENQLQKFIIWFNIFIFISLPSIVYICCVFIGSIKTKTGYTGKENKYNFWEYDFRYAYLQEYYDFIDKQKI